MSLMKLLWYMKISVKWGKYLRMQVEKRKFLRNLLIPSIDHKELSFQSTDDRNKKWECIKLTKLERWSKLKQSICKDWNWDWRQQHQFFVHWHALLPSQIWLCRPSTACLYKMRQQLLDDLNLERIKMMKRNKTQLTHDTTECSDLTKARCS